MPGGEMISGKQEYRVPTQYVLDELKVVEDSGVQIICDHPIDNDKKKKKEYDAVLVAIGTSVGKKLT